MHGPEKCDLAKMDLVQSLQHLICSTDWDQETDAAEVIRQWSGSGTKCIR